LRLRVAIEEITRIEFVVSEKLEKGTVKVVRARLGDDIHGSAGVTTKLGFDVCLNCRFGNGFDWQDGCWRSEDTRFIDGRQISIAIVHVGAIEQIVVCAPAIAVRAEQSE